MGRVWADGREINLSTIAHRFYTGSEAQEPDSAITAHLGAGNAPAFRGTAYVVFESMALAAFGNRIPQLSFEVYRAVEPFNDEVKGIVLIPGSGEFVYATEPVTQDLGAGYTAAENVHTRQGETDWSVSIDQLEATLPNATSVSLVVSWFGDDLRAGECQLQARALNSRPRPRRRFHGALRVWVARARISSARATAGPHMAARRRTRRSLARLRISRRAGST